MAETFRNPDDTPPQPDSDTIQHWLSLHAAGDASARQKLLENSMQRLELLTRRMLADNVWLKTREETGDVLQNASIRLLAGITRTSARHNDRFFRLAACLIRRELIDLSRHHCAASIGLLMDSTRPALMFTNQPIDRLMIPETKVAMKPGTRPGSVAGRLP